MPYKGGAFVKCYAAGLFSISIEEAYIDARRSFGKNGKVGSFFIGGSAQGIGAAREQRSDHGPVDADRLHICCIVSRMPVVCECPALSTLCRHRFCQPSYSQHSNVVFLAEGF